MANYIPPSKRKKGTVTTTASTSSYIPPSKRKKVAPRISIAEQIKQERLKRMYTGPQGVISPEYEGGYTPAATTDKALPADTVSKLKTSTLAVPDMIKNITQATDKAKEATGLKLKAPTGIKWGEVIKQAANEGVASTDVGIINWLLRKPYETVKEIVSNSKVLSGLGKLNNLVDKTVGEPLREWERNQAWIPKALKPPEESEYNKDVVQEALDNAVEYFEKEAEKSGKIIAEKGTPIQKAAAAGITGAVQMVPNIALAATSRSPGALLGQQGKALSAMTAQSGAKLLGLNRGTIVEAGQKLKELIPFMSQAAGQYAREAEKKGAPLGQQLTAGTFQGLEEGITEMIPFDTLKRVLGASDDVIKPIAKKGIKYTMEFLKRYGRDALTNIVTNVAQEIAVNPLTSLTAKAIYDKDIPLTGQGGIFDTQAARDSAISAVAMSLIFTALGLPSSSASYKKASKLMSQQKMSAAEMDNLADIIKQDMGKKQPITAEEELQQAITTPKTDTEKLAEEIRQETEKISQQKAAEPAAQKPTFKTAETVKPVEKPTLKPPQKVKPTLKPPIEAQQPQPESVAGQYKPTTGDVLEQWQVDLLTDKLTPESLKTAIDKGEGVDRNMLPEKLQKAYDEYKTVKPAETQAETEPVEKGQEKKAKEIIREIPKYVQRIEEPNVSRATIDKPHGIYTSPSTVESPHRELGGNTYYWETNPDAKVLKIEVGTFRTNRGLVGESAGIAAARKFLDDNEVSRMMNLNKGELVKELASKYPDVSWDRYYDQQEMVEGYAGLLAKEKGYDAIWAIDKDATEFNEFVGLTDNAMKQIDNIPAQPAQKAAAEEAKAAAPTIEQPKTTAKKLKVATEKPTLKKPEIQKAAVKTPTLVAPKAKTETEIRKPVRRSDIEKFVSDTLDIPVAQGRFRQKALGVFKVRPEVIRLKKTKDPDTLFHEVGHFLDKHLDLTGTQHNNELLELGRDATKSNSPSERITEGAAEFVRYYVLDPEQAKKIAPNFYKAFEEKIGGNKDYAYLMETVRTAMDNYMKQSPEMRILSNISVGGKPKKIGMNPERLYTLSIDELAPLKRVVEQMTGGETVRTSDNPFELAWLYRGWQGKAETFLNHSSINEDYEKIGKSFKEILKPVNKKLDEFRAYGVAKRAQELKQRNIETGLDMNDVNLILEKNTGNTLFENVFTELVKFQDNVLHQLVETGMLSEESAAAMRALNENYVPFNRVFEALEKGTGKGYQTFQTVKGIKGSFRDIVDPLESIIKNTYTITNMAERNRVGKALAELSEKYEGNGKFIDRVPPDMVPQTFTLEEIKKALTEAGADTEVMDLEKAATIFRPQMIKGKDNIITVFRDGKPEYYQVFDDSLYRTFMALDKETASTLVKLMSYPAKFLRAGATLTPEFIGRNPIRDTFTAAVYSRYGFVPGIDTIRGLFHVLARDDLYTKLMSSGALQSNMVSMDRDYLQKNLRQLLRTKLKDKTLNIITHPMDVLRALSEVMEEGTRIGEGVKGMARETLREQGQINIADNILAYFAPETVIKKYGTSAETLRKSSLASRDVTLDFARAGIAGKQINKAVAFFNAALQGGDKMIRMFLPEKKTVDGKTVLDFTRPIKTTAKALLTITLPSLLLYRRNKDDERYQELPQWQKDLFWIVLTKDRIYRIPKPFELGIIFGSIPERMMQWAETQDKSAFDGLDETIKEAMLPNILPTIFLPPIEAIANYSFFTGQPIVPESEERLQAPEQYGPYTSETSKLLGKLFNYSPRKIENVLKGYGGGLASYGTQLTDKLINLSGASEERVLAAKDITQQPLLKGFTAKEFVSSKSVNDIYDKLKKLEAEYNTAKGKKEINSIDEFAKKDELVKLRSVTEQLSELRTRTKDIYSNNNMTPEEKRKSIDQINMAMAAVARTGMGRDAAKLKSSITMMNKGFFDSYGNTPGAKLLLDVFDKTNETKYFPRIASSKMRIFSQDIYLNESQLKEMQEYLDKAASKNLDSLAKDERFGELSYDEKIEAISDMNQGVLDMAKEYMAGKLGVKKQLTLKKPTPKFRVVKP